MRAASKRLARLPDSRLEVRALGLRFSSPLGVAAGVDKDASWFEGLGMLGFGHVEVGTVTASAQSGNPRPRVFRLVSDRALLNRMGFPNPGAAAVAERLAGRRSGGTVVGVNVGRSASAEDAAADYRRAVRQLAPAADYLVVNVSSPNTPGLRDLQAAERLGPLIGEVQAELASVGREVPLLLKISPDLSDEQLDELADLAVELGLAGLIAVNTTIDRGVLGSSKRAAEAIEGGGVSGAPLKARSVEVLRRLHARVGSELVLISVGGVETADDVLERIRAGATLVQAYTGFVYGGPTWPRRINRDLARSVSAAGKSSIQELVGPELEACMASTSYSSGCTIRQRLPDGSRTVASMP